MRTALKRGDSSDAHRERDVWKVPGWRRGGEKKRLVQSRFCCLEGQEEQAKKLEIGVAEVNGGRGRRICVGEVAHVLQ
jgi:hypothetical protein